MLSRPISISFNHLHWLPVVVYSYIHEQINGCKKVDMFIEKDGGRDGLDNWLVLDTVIDITNEEDLFIKSMINRIKHATGYFDFEKILQQEGFGNDLDVSGLKQAILSTIPPHLNDNPDFPKHLEVRRNEFGELMAQEVLESETNIKFPFSTHSLIENPDTTKKGLDGFGLIDLAGDKKLVVVEAKTSEDRSSPPSVAKSLMEDCRNVLSPKGKRKLIRTLYAMAMRYQTDHDVTQLILKWIASIDHNPADVVHHICPVIIRGCITSKATDLSDFMGENQDYSPNGSIGVSCSTGGNKIIDLCNMAYEKVKLNDG